MLKTISRIFIPHLHEDFRDTVLSVSRPITVNVAPEGEPKGSLRKWLLVEVRPVSANSVRSVKIQGSRVCRNCGGSVAVTGVCI